MKLLLDENPSCAFGEAPYLIGLPLTHKLPNSRLRHGAGGCGYGVDFGGRDEVR